MDLGLSEEQEILKASARRFLSSECPKILVRDLDKRDDGYSRELWRKMAALGWIGLAIPSEYGGSGGTFLDLVVLLEEMGYNILPGPFFSTTALGSLPILSAGNETQKKAYLPKIAAGDMILTLALNEHSADYDAASVMTNASASGDDYVINGTKLFVPDAHVADLLLCVTKTKEGGNATDCITIFLVDFKSPGITCTLLKTLARDKQCEVVLNNVRVPGKNMLGELNRGWSVVTGILEKATVAKCAEMVGGAQAVLDMALKYANERVQFGQPIGNFQAIQHYCADMAIEVYSARLITYEAAWTISEGLPATKLVSMAKAWTSEAYSRVTTLGQQIHGAVGFTIDHDMHLYYRRAKTAEMMFGDSYYHREIVAQKLGL